MSPRWPRPREPSGGSADPAALNSGHRGVGWGNSMVALATRLAGLDPDPFQRTCGWRSWTWGFSAVKAWRLGKRVSQGNPFLPTTHTPICPGFNPFPLSVVVGANFEAPITRITFLVSFDGASTKASLSVRPCHFAAPNPPIAPYVSHTLLRMVHHDLHDLFPFGLISLISCHSFPLLQPQRLSCCSSANTRHLLPQCPCIWWSLNLECPQTSPFQGDLPDHNLLPFISNTPYFPPYSIVLSNSYHYLACYIFNCYFCISIASPPHTHRLENKLEE